MGKAIKYQPGCTIHQYELLSRDYTTGYGNWFCTFKCLTCGTIFQARLKNIVHGGQPCLCRKSNKAQLIGKTKGVLTVIKEAPSKPNDRNAYWICRCICGKEVEISTTDFNRYEHNQCLHYKIHPGGRPPQDLINKRYDKVIVKEYLGNQYWRCFCDCGEETVKRTDQLSRDSVSCSKCTCHSNGEKRIQNILLDLNIAFEQEKTFESCRFPDTQCLARFDFYLPEKNLLIEYNGVQHYKTNTSGWNTEEHLAYTQEHDKFKSNWCETHGYKLLIIPYTDYNKLNKDYLLSLL